jgi:phosphatidylglycerophosphatase C
VSAEVTSGVAVFDFDKTLSTRDNVLPFLVAVVGRGALTRALAASFPDLARARRDAVKARLARVLTGRSEHELGDASRRFATDVLSHHLRDDVVARAEWHAEQGHQRVICSASFECYLAPIAAELGFDAALGTRLETRDGHLTGRLDGPNVRHAEKVRRLDEWLAGRAITVWAYGDSGGDRELLARADHPVKVGRVKVSRVAVRRRPLDTASDDERVAR